MKVHPKAIGKIFLIFVLTSFVYTTLGQDIKLKIVGGAITRKGRWPWQAMVIGKKRGIDALFSCGATLISPSYLLTSAYCPIGFYRIQVILGMWNFSAPTEMGRKSYGVARIINHPCFNEQETNSYADIALIKIRKQIAYPSNDDVVCLPNDAPGRDWNILVHDADIEDCIATGYGVGPTKRTSLGVLNEVEFPYLSRRKCQEFYEHQLPDDKLCSYGAAGRATCKGDMGGPILCPNSKEENLKCERYYLAGTISNTASDCDVSKNTDRPSIFTATFPHIPWIKHVLATGKSLPISCPGKIVPKSDDLNEFLENPE